MTVMTTSTCMAGMAGKTGILMAGNVGASGTVQMTGEVGIGMATITAVVGIAVVGIIVIVAMEQPRNNWLDIFLLNSRWRGCYFALPFLL